jgi:hypothetical protein
MVHERKLFLVSDPGPVVQRPSVMAGAQYLICSGLLPNRKRSHSLSVDDLESYLADT